jgi:hypothetical protein
MRTMALQCAATPCASQQIPPLLLLLNTQLFGALAGQECLHLLSTLPAL